MFRRRTRRSLPSSRRPARSSSARRPCPISPPPGSAIVRHRRTKNPYDLTRDPGGSSAGTGAAVSANLAAIGIGEDTGGWIRLPSSFYNLVGVRVTPGLISRKGLSPLGYARNRESDGPNVKDTATSSTRSSATIRRIPIRGPFLSPAKGSYTENPTPTV